jgi:hypothetical protein
MRSKHELTRQQEDVIMTIDYRLTEAVRMGLVDADEVLDLIDNYIAHKRLERDTDHPKLFEHE